METGKQDSRIREQLDKLRQVPDGFQFRSALVWQEIETRLTEKKRRPFRWLYAAAAAILLCIGGWWFQHKKAPDPAVKSPFVSTKTNSTPGKDTLQKLTTRVDQPQPSIQVTARQPEKLQIEPLKATAVHIPLVIVDSSSPLMVAATAADSLSMPVAIAKPRFRIAHINELDNHNNTSDLAQQPLTKKPLMTTFLFSPKNITEDIIIKENTRYVDAKPQGMFKSVQITKD